MEFLIHFFCVCDIILKMSSYIAFFIVAKRFESFHRQIHFSLIIPPLQTSCDSFSPLSHENWASPYFFPRNAVERIHCPIKFSQDSINQAMLI